MCQGLPSQVVGMSWKSRGVPLFFFWLDSVDFHGKIPKKKWMRTGGSPILRIETLICQIMSIRKVPIDKNWIWKKHQGVFWFFSMALPTLNQNQNGRSSSSTLFRKPWGLASNGSSTDQAPLQREILFRSGWLQPRFRSGTWRKNQPELSDDLQI